MTTPKTNRLATSEEIERINKDADEAGCLYFEGSLSESEARQPLQADAEADPPVFVDKTEFNQRR
jgi:hypothetical protein